MDSVDFSIVVVEIALLLSTFVTLYEWGTRRFAATRETPSRFVGEIWALSIVTLILFVILWNEFYLIHGFLALALAIAWASALLFPLGATGFYLCLLLLRPWEMLPSVDIVLSLPRAFAITVIVSWIFHQCIKKSDRIYLSSSFVSYLCMLLWMVVSGFAIGIGGDAWEFVNEQFFPVTVIFLLLIQMPESRRDIHFFQIHLVIALVGLLSSALIQTFGGVEGVFELQRLRAGGLFGNSNDLASLIVLVFPMLFFSFIIKEKDMLSKIVASLVCLFFVLCLWLTQSRGAFLSVFLMGVTWLYVSKRSGKFSALPFILIPVVLTFVIFRGQGDLDGSSSSRWNYIIAALRMTSSSPIFGIGINRYPELYELFTPSFEEWGKRTAHSSWLLVMAETGIPGLIFFLAMYLYAFFEAYKMRTQYPEYILVLVGYGISISLLSHTYIFLPYMIVGLIGGAARVRRKTLTTVATCVVSLALLFPVKDLSAELLVVPDLDKPFSAEHEKLTNSLSLIGARGEVLSFFIRLPEGRGCDAPRVGFNEDFRGKASFYFLPYISIEHRSYPNAPLGRQIDPVVPVAENKLCLSSNGPSWILGEVEISRRELSGVYKGELSFLKERTPLEIRVIDREIPLQPNYPLYTEMTTWYNLLGHYGKWVNTEATLALEYNDLLRAHRIETLTSVIATPRVMSSRGGKKKLDLVNHPTPAQSFTAMNLDPKPEWAYVGFPTVPKDKIGTHEAKNYLEALEATVPEVGRPGKSFIYLWDEPQREEFPLFMQFLDSTRRVVKNAKLMVTTPYERQLHDLIDIYVPVAEEIGGKFAPISTYKKLQREGKEFWWYVSCMSHGCGALADTGSPDLVIDRPAVYIRSIGWLGVLLGTDAFLYYHTNHGYQSYPGRDPWQSLWDFSGNGDGTLTYPGRPGMHGLTEHTPIGSVRLKLLRQTSYDAQYVQWMEELPSQPKWWSEAKAGLITDFLHWNRDYWAYSDTRRRIAEHLESVR